MTIVVNGPARIPGPFGTVPVSVDGKYPNMPGNARGPAGYYPLFDTKNGPAGTQTATKAATKAHAFKMPKAFDSASATTKVARVVDWPLFGKSGPKTTDISQGALPNCPLPTILAAMANTADGRKRILAMVTPHDDAAVTDLSDVLDQVSDQTGSVTSKRYFTVKLAKEIEVSDVLYTDDADSGWSPLYMQASDSGSPVLWACVIEKAYAVQEGGYDKLNEMVVNKVWKDILGAKPNGFEINGKTDLEKIRERAANASKVPTILASKNDKSIEDASKQKVVHDHGYAVLGMTGNTVNLYNPWGNAVSLPIGDIRKYFQSMFYP